jgi:hypothetical protein
MAFPQVVGTPANSQSSAAATGHTLNLPSGITAGETLLLAVISRQQVAAGDVTVSGFTAEGSVLQGTSVGLWIFTKTATGSEGATVAESQVASSQVTARAYRISGTSGEIEATGVGSTSNVNADPPNLDPAGWGTEDTLWMAFCGANSGNDDVSTWPTSYTATGSIFAGLSGRPTMGYGQRELAAASEDPSAFSFTAAQINVAMTVAIRPAAAAAQFGRTAPDAILGVKGLTGSLTDIDDDPNSADGDWLVIG